MKLKKTEEEKDNYIPLRAKHGKSLDFPSADFQSLFLEGTGQGNHIFYGLRRGAPLAQTLKPCLLQTATSCSIG